MHRTYGIAIGAGLASALLFIASARSAGLAIVIAYLTPLPLMIATLGFGRSTGLVAALLACGSITTILEWRSGLFFGALLGLPSWWLSSLVLLARPAVAAPSPTPPPTTPPLVWYPIGRVAVWGAAIVAGVVVATGGLIVLRYGGFEDALSVMSTRLSTVIGASAAEDLPDATTARGIVRLLPLLMAASAFLMLMINLWLAGRAVERSGLITRPWPTLPEHFRLPKPAAGVAVAAGLVSLIGGPVGLACGVVAAAFAMAFVLQGLGAAHALTRGLVARRLILTAIYFIVLTIVPSLIALAVLGVVDCLLPLRERRQSAKPPLTKT